MSLENLELALHMTCELTRLNKTQDLFPDFWKFTIQYYEEFPEEYRMNSHTRRNTTGVLEKHVVTYLIKMCCYKCSLMNCQISSQIMALLGYHSYRVMTNRFRQKVENYLRKERKEGGLVPPSTRSFPYYSIKTSESSENPNTPFTRSAARHLSEKQKLLKVSNNRDKESSSSDIIETKKKLEIRNYDIVESDATLKDRSSSFDSYVLSNESTTDQD